ncbi:hypothetical protein [Streptomyces noursei]|uniref:hypothetical protein n=1 Tax=Streptomyces noursei TaxID=1971 RepID=UPI0016779E05|nr:hypothetical protein [Streptomyces noursei]MCZ1013474.1 hypothetical protein [Streptomyces noursei]
MSSTRWSRSLPWAGAVVGVLLTTLLHVLCCSHGPTETAAPRADAVLYASPVTCGQLPAKAHRETAAGRSAPAPDHGAHCGDWDQPTIQPPRDEGLAGPPVSAVVPLWSAGPHLGIPPPAPRRSPAQATALSDGPTRALLGVWRN